MKILVFQICLQVYVLISVIPPEAPTLPENCSVPNMLIPLTPTNFQLKFPQFRQLEI